MMSGLPSIFNDVMGPVMRGPSSSHTAASWRIARTSLQLLNDELDSALVELDKNGVWASNYREQGTAMGMDGGLLGIDISDEKIKDPETVAHDKGVSIEYRISSFKTGHTNTVRLSLKGRSGKQLKIIAVSTGGGMFEIRQLNGQDVSISGESYECLYYDKGRLVQKKSPVPFSKESIDMIRAGQGENEPCLADPLLTVVSGRESTCPFTGPADMLEYAGSNKLSLGEAGLLHEKCRSGLPEKDLKREMSQIIGIIEKGISRGLEGTSHPGRILQQQSHLIHKLTESGQPGPGQLVNRIIENISALMEAKSALELIVAVPTAGSCGTFGGTLKAYCDLNGIPEEKKVLAYFAGGLTGVFFAMGPGFSAEEHGCQVETGAAACMTAAALVEASGGSALQATAAASIALQNTIGLICDPVADRVEVPCLGRNVAAGMNALSSSAMALAGFDQVIPLEQVIDSVERVGKMLPCELCNSGLGGLSTTPASVDLKNKLKNRSI